MEHAGQSLNYEKLDIGGQFHMLNFDNLMLINLKFSEYVIF